MNTTFESKSLDPELKKEKNRIKLGFKSGSGSAWKLMPAYSCWDFIKKFSKIGMSLRGHSRGSERSGFYIPELKLMLDAGVSSPFNPEGIFITHCHVDHSYAFPMLITCVKTQPLITVPEPHVQLFKNFNSASYQLNNGYEISTPDINIKGVSKGCTFDYRKNYKIKVFEMDHSVPTVGYGICEKRTKLKPELIGMDRKELIKLKKKQNCFNEILVPKLAYVCDTTTKAFELNPELLDFKVIIVECTFICEDTYSLAQKSKHTHYRDLYPIIISNPNIDFILIHFSMRYKNIMEAFENIGLLDLPKNAFVWEN